MPTRIYSEETIKKRKILSGDEKPTRKYTKHIKQEIKKEPLDMSESDIDDDDVMDIEEADGTLPKKGKLHLKQKRIMKTKKVKKVLKLEKDLSDTRDLKVKPKRKKKLPPATVANEAIATPAKALLPADILKPTKRVAKIKEKKMKTKPPKPAKKSEKDGTKENDSDSDSSVEESDAYETCGVTNCQRPSGKKNKFYHRKSFNQFCFRICPRLDPLRWRMRSLVPYGMRWTEDQGS